MRLCAQWKVSVIIFTALCLAASPAHAVEGNPIALRSWPGGAISIETQWDLHLAVNASAPVIEKMPRKPDQAIQTGDRMSHILFRAANQAEASWVPIAEAPNSDSNAIKVTTIAASASEIALLQIEVDGVRMLLVSPGFNADFPKIEGIDLLIFGATNGPQSPARAKAAVEAYKPRVMLLNVTDDLSTDDVERYRLALGVATATTTSHNTLAISSIKESDDELRLVMLANTPWQMPEKLEAPFASMEKACRDSQEVFAKLSTSQMNFKPSNGTHTPRWNTEHMMGRQLLFFSQIFHAQDAQIPIMNLNPKQMPPDYKFAHPDWDGREEARQMQRVSSFTRRFAYLLADLDVEKKAPGSSWPSLRALLDQMNRHYSEHTANTVKKFTLPDWPQE